MKRQDERFSEEARRRTMYGLPSSVLVGLSQFAVFTRGWKLLVTIDEI